MTKVPDPIDVSPELRAEAKRLEEIRARKIAAESKAKLLDQRIRTGPTADDRESEVARVLANEPSQNPKDEFEKALRDFRALEDAERQQMLRVEAIKKEACRKICEDLRPLEIKLMKKLASGLYDAHSVWGEVYAIKRALQDKGIGLGGLFEVDPQEFFGSPLDRTSDFAGFMRDCVRAGYLGSLPKEFR